MFLHKGRDLLLCPLSSPVAAMAVKHSHQGGVRRRAVQEQHSVLLRPFAANGLWDGGGVCGGKGGAKEVVGVSVGGKEAVP
jgi:hypothetical protein